MDIEIFKIILQFLSTIGVGAVISGIISKRLTTYESKKINEEKSKKKEEEDSRELIKYLSEANKLMLRNTIYDICNKVKKRGYIYLYEAENLREILEVYEKLGGNGTAHATAAHVLDTYEVITAEDEID